MKNAKNMLMHALSFSVLLGLSSTSFADLVINSSGGVGQAALSWSSADASQLLNDDSIEDDGEEVKVGDKKYRNKYSLAKVTVPHQCKVCDGPLVMGGPIWN